jgi:hypothetical protein
MRDVIYLLVLVGFFVVAAGVVRLCESVIGPDDAVSSSSATDADTSSTTDAEPGELVGNRVA